MQGTAAFTPSKPDGREVNVNRSNITTSIHNDWGSQHVYVNCMQIHNYYIVLFNFGFDTFTRKKTRYVSFGFIWNLDVQFCINNSQMGNKYCYLHGWYTIQLCLSSSGENHFSLITFSYIVGSSYIVVNLVSLFTNKEPQINLQTWCIVCSDH